jgi:integrase
LPDEQSRLLAEVAIQAGLRWGELIELHRRDPDPPTRMLTIERTAVELRPTFHPSGGRFLVKDYPKNRHFRRIKLSHALVIRLTAFAMARSLGSDDPLFTAPAVPCRPSVRERPDPGNLGATETECSRAPIPARDVDRVLDGPVPVWSLPGRLRPLPGDAPRGR